MIMINPLIPIFASRVIIDRGLASPSPIFMAQNVYRNAPFLDVFNDGFGSLDADAVRMIFQRA